MIEYAGPAAVHLEIWTADMFDGGNTRRIRNDGSTYINSANEEVTGTMSSTAPAGTGGDTTPPGKVAGLTVTPIQLHPSRPSMDRKPRTRCGSLQCLQRNHSWICCKHSY